MAAEAGKLGTDGEIFDDVSAALAQGADGKNDFVKAAKKAHVTEGAVNQLWEIILNIYNQMSDPDELAWAN